MFGWRCEAEAQASGVSKPSTAATHVRDWAQTALAFQPSPKILVCVALSGAGLAGCAQHPQQFAHSKEYFPSSIYGRASERVVADGEAVPRGGGQYLVGKPYTVAGRTYYPSEKKHYSATGLASWYGDAFHGRRTANGEVYDRDSISAAHPTMPLPSYARVTNLRNAHSMIVRVNDRGPFASDRVMDVSRGVAEALDFRHSGTTMVKVDYIGPAGLQGSDDRRLLATLRLDGRPASFDGTGDMPTMVAESEPRRVASLEASAPQRALSEEPEAEPVKTPSPRAETFRAEAARSETPRSEASKTERETLNNLVEEIATPADKPFIGKAPLPPSRPFDLGTIPGAGSQISSR
jgi:rare lipoprotein A